MQNRKERLAGFLHHHVGVSLPAHQAGNADLILVFQMGRVGSKSIEGALGHFFAGSTTKVLHGHYLHHFEELERRARADLAHPDAFMVHLTQVDGIIRGALQQVPARRKVKVVSLVRDPVARSVSTFFYTLDEFIPEWRVRAAGGTLGVDELRGVFESKRSFVMTAMHWFDEQMKPAFDIDVYATPFPTAAGYRIYSSNKADLLLLRLEDLEVCGPRAFREFLGIPNLALPRVNTGVEREVGELYRQFRETLLSPEYVQWSYEFKLARHFYTDAERERFRQSWTMR